MNIYPIFGAVHGDATAFVHRGANFATVIAGMWPDPDRNANSSSATEQPKHPANEGSTSEGAHLNRRLG